MKSLALLGSTGSIGCSTLKIVAKFPKKFKIKTLTAKSNIDQLIHQIKMFHPELVAVYDKSSVHHLRARLPEGLNLKIVYGAEGYKEAACFEGVEMTVGAMVGAAGLEPIMAAIEAGKDIALANKETLVMAGELVKSAVARKGVRLLPIDSEHSAIFQCLQGQRHKDLTEIILTASGGPFLNTPANEFEHITPSHALKHPNWAMGSKITIDSATLMNKGLEIIEAKWLFDLAPSQIKVVVHPQSIIHSMVAFCDGAILAQMGIPDMQEAIAYALSYPKRMPLQQLFPDLVKLGALTFYEPDRNRFPCLQLAFDALSQGGTMPTVLNASNEIAVHAFLANKLPFIRIPSIIRDVMAAHTSEKVENIAQILSIDGWARKKAQSMVAKQATI